MRGNLMVAASLVASACIPSTATVTPAPASSAPVCVEDTAPSVIYLVDGAPVTCTAAMAIPRTHIAWVEVLKGDAALALYGVSPAGGVVSIQTKK